MTKLTALKVKHAGRGFHGDGQGLYLSVSESGAKSWILRVQYAKKRRDIGLGSATDVSLAEARERAAKLRKAAREGFDPVAVRESERAANAALVPLAPPTFAEIVVKAHKQLGEGWSEKTAAQFRASLELHAVPSLGRKPVATITTSDVIAALAPIWTEKPQIARKVRHRIIQVLAFAKSHGLRSEAVPTADELRRGLARQPKSQSFAAVPYREVPALFAGELAKAQSPARLALLFTILTAARSGEVRNARWSQIDREAKIWSRPAEMMKSDLPHVVTLSSAALALLDRVSERFGDEDLIFPSARKGRPLSDMSLSKMLREGGREETVHGFRSSFRDWAAEMMPTVPAMVAEMALAHSVGTKVEQAYLRSDLREHRRALLEAWGQFVAPSLSEGAGNVVQLGRRA